MLGRRKESFVPAWNRTLDHPAHSHRQVTIPGLLLYGATKEKEEQVCQVKKYTYWFLRMCMMLLAGQS